MKKLIPILMVAAVACNQKPAEKPVDTENVAYTKTMEYAVELGSVFHEDLNDENFSDVSPLAENLIAKVLEGKLKAYDRGSDEVLSPDQAREILVFTDTIWFEEPETGDVSIDIVERDYTKDFFGFTFREQWSFNEENAIIERKIVGIAPRIPVFSSQGGDLRGFTSAFWVKYE